MSGVLSVGDGIYVNNVGSGLACWTFRLLCWALVLRKPVLIFNGEVWAEALLRWNTPTHARLGQPTDFIRLESSGLIIDIGVGYQSRPYKSELLERRAVSLSTALTNRDPVPTAIDCMPLA
jgi:hypothetical protein